MLAVFTFLDNVAITKSNNLTLTLNPWFFLYIHMFFKLWKSLRTVCVGVYICMFFCVLSGGWASRQKTSAHPSLSVFTLSLNSRPATGANGALICSWMTHTCCLRRFPNSQWPFRATLALQNIFLPNILVSWSVGMTSALSHFALFVLEMLSPTCNSSSGRPWCNWRVSSTATHLWNQKTPLLCGRVDKATEGFGSFLFFFVRIHGNTNWQLKGGPP